MVKDKHLHIRCSDELKETVERLAGIKGLSVSETVCWLILKEAKKEGIK